LIVSPIKEAEKPELEVPPQIIPTIVAMLASSPTAPKKVTRRQSTSNGLEKSRKSYKKEFATFRAQYPEYDQSSTLDVLRKTQFGRLKKADEVYVDYMGGCLWPECLVATHAAILQAGLFGNTHSDSPWYVFILIGVAFI